MTIHLGKKFGPKIDVNPVNMMTSLTKGGTEIDIFLHFAEINKMYIIQKVIFMVIINYFMSIQFCFLKIKQFFSILEPFIL